MLEELKGSTALETTFRDFEKSNTATADIATQKYYKFLKSQYLVISGLGQKKESLPTFGNFVVTTETTALNTLEEIEPQSKPIDLENYEIFLSHSSSFVTIQYDDYPHGKISNLLAEQRKIKWIDVLCELESCVIVAEEKVSEKIKRQIEDQLKSLWMIGKEEYFEEGMENRFLKGFNSFVSNFGEMGLAFFYKLYCEAESNLEILSESLKYLGHIENKETKDIRFNLLIHHLNHPSYLIRDSVLIGLVLLNDKKAIWYLMDNIKDEKSEDFRNDLRQAILDLRNE